MATIPDSGNKQATKDAPDYVTKTGKIVPSRRRFASCNANWSCYKRLFDEDQQVRARNRVQVMKLRDGFPILSQSALQADGQLWRANHNNMDAQSDHNQHAAALWAHEFTVETLIRCKVENVMRAKREQLQTQEVCGIIAEEYTRTMKAWPDFFFQQMMTASDEVTFGIGYPVWFDDYDFRSETVPHGSVKFSPTVRAGVESLDLLYVERDMRVLDMLNILDLDKPAEDMGWSLAEIKRLLIRRYYTEREANKTVKYSDAEWFATRRKIDNLLTDTEDLGTIGIIYCFAKNPGQEEDWSMWAFEALQNTDDKREYLFERHGKRKSVMEIVCPFFYNIGNGYMRGIRGLLQMLYPQYITKLRMELGMCDAAVLSACVILEDSGSNDLRTLKLGPIVRLPQGGTPMQRSFAPNMDGLASVWTLMTRQKQEHAGIYTQVNAGTQERGNRVTAEQIKSEVEKEGTLKGFQSMMHNAHRDRYHRECLRRLLVNDTEGSKGYKESQAFRKRCRDRGVPAWLLKPEELDVIATRAVGHGSPSMARMNMERLLQTAQVGLRSEKETATIVRDFTALLVGWENVEDYARHPNEIDTPSEEMSFAQLENNSIRKGEQIVFAEDQDHEVHAKMPLMLLAQLQQAYEAGKQGQAQPIDPRMLIPAFVVGLPHIFAHVNAFGKYEGNKEKAKPMYQAYKRIAAFGKKLESDARAVAQQEQEMMAKQAQEQMPEAAARDPVLREEARKDEVVKADILRKDAVATAEVQRKAAKAQVDMQAKMMKTAQQVGVPQVPEVRPIPTLEEQGAM